MFDFPICIQLLHEFDESSPECAIAWETFESGDCEGLFKTNPSDMIPCQNLERMTLDQISAQLQMDGDVYQRGLANLTNAKMDA